MGEDENETFPSKEKGFYLNRTFGRYRHYSDISGHPVSRFRAGARKRAASQLSE
jgi:hypothetical protein